MTDLRKAAEMALFAMDYHTMQTRPIIHTDIAIQTLRAAIAKATGETK